MRCDLFIGSSLTAQSRCSSTSLPPLMAQKETSAAEMHQRIIAMATEQSPRIPAKFGSALGPVFGRVQEVVAIAHELMPSVPWDVSWWTIIVEAGDPLDPTD